MVGTIRRTVQQEINTSNAPPPPSYQAATSPTTAGPSVGVGVSGGSGSGGSINAGAFQRNPSSTSSRHSVAVSGGGYGQPLPQIPTSQRPMSYAQPGGAPPPGHQQQQQQQYQQPPGPPPAQLPQPGSNSNAPPPPRASGSLQRSNTQEDRLSVLRRYDTVILIDDSASMNNLWREAEAALSGIVEQVIKYDNDGLDIYFLNSTHALQGARDSGAIRELFQYVGPVGESTPTEIRVEELLSPYIDLCERSKASGQPLPKPLNLLVLTDGEADDPDTLAYTLQGFAKRLDDIRAPLTQLGIQFVQIGNDPSATEALKQLDDELQGCRDMVDTTPYSGKISADFLVKVALGSINRRIDRSG
ncbi:hypothetical protein P389DRAFT_170496 [Cystobasidium minutum MCA 4210]|uniref:uncharacterized protein n=1 Tax=Cystobasidium minutum MCA 4210 TaxID=1397322 RepID=UPI0034CD6505|eukprot:jgi/Rhomi1/170496/fgenesh1_kg.4_\